MQKKIVNPAKIRRKMKKTHGKSAYTKIKKVSLGYGKVKSRL